MLLGEARHSAIESSKPRIMMERKPEKIGIGHLPMTGNFARERLGRFVERYGIGQKAMLRRCEI